MKKLIITLLVSITLLACKKTEEKVADNTNYSSEQEFTTAENDFNTVLKDVEDALVTEEDNTAGAKTTQNSCITNATVYMELNSDSAIGTSYENYLEIDFENGCGNFGTTQTGKIIVFFSGRRINGDFRDSVRFSGFGINGRSISGIKMVTQIPTNDTDIWEFDVKVTNGVVKFNDGRTVTYNSERTRTNTGVSTLFDVTDDQFIITGTANGKNSSGDITTVTITEDLVLDSACEENFFRIPVSGEIEFKNTTKSLTRTINYGDGACDKKVTINANGYTFDWTVL